MIILRSNSLMVGVLALAALCLLQGCGQAPMPKQRAYFRLDYPVHAYVEQVNEKAPYRFERADWSRFTVRDRMSADLFYPQMNATLYLTYRPVSDVDSMLADIEKITYSHAVKASSIGSRAFENSPEKVYAAIYSVEGDVASNLQFYATDSVRHMLCGSVYFYSVPNYDSLAPAVDYLREDLVRLVESLRWDD